MKNTAPYMGWFYLTIEECYIYIDLTIERCFIYIYLYLSVVQSMPFYTLLAIPTFP